MYFVKVSFALVLLAVVNELVAGEFVQASPGPIYAYYYNKDNIKHRARRSPQNNKFTLSGNHQDGTSSLRGDLSGTLLKTDRTTLDGNAYYQRNFGPFTPKYQTGGALNLNHDSGLRSSLTYDKTAGVGPFSSTSSLRGDVSGTLLKTDRTTLDGNAYYQRNFGPFTPKYQTGAGLNLNHDSGLYGKVNYDQMPGASRVGATTGYKLFESKDGRSSFGAEAFYNRNMGGLGPNKDYGFGAVYRRNF